MSSAKYAIAPSFATGIAAKAQGWLTEDDLRLLLEGQRDIARIRANNQSIARQAQLQATLLRLLDITLLALAGRL